MIGIQNVVEAKEDFLIFRCLFFTLNILSVVVYSSIIMEVANLVSLFILIYISFSIALTEDFSIENAIASILYEHFVKTAWTVEAINFGRSDGVLETVLSLKQE